MDIFTKPINVAFVAAVILAVSGFVVRSAVTEGDGFIITLALFGMFLCFCLLNKKIFVFLTCCALASVNLNLVGVDPGDVLIPGLLFHRAPSRPPKYTLTKISFIINIIFCCVRFLLCCFDSDK